MNKTKDLITLEAYNDSFHAHLVKSKLESEGIPCFIFDENTSNLGPHYNQFVGGIKLKIHSTDQEKALNILREHQHKHPTDQSGDLIRCPDCHSEHIEAGVGTTRGLNGFFHGVLSVAMASFPFTNTAYYFCRDCGKRFKHKHRN